MKKWWISILVIVGLAALAVYVKQSEDHPRPPAPIPPPDVQPAPPKPTPTPAPAPQPEPSFAVTTKCSSKAWPAEWSGIVDKAIDDYGKVLLTGDIGAEGMAICPRYNELDKAARKKVWSQLVATIACPESGFNPKSQYHESFGIWSLGLMQMSYEDYPRHARCDLRKADGSKATAEKPADGNAFEPNANLRCAVAVLDTQISKGLGIFQDGKPYYWSVLNKSTKSTPQDPRGKDKTKAIWKRYYAGVQSLCGPLPQSLAAEVAPTSDIEAPEPRGPQVGVSTPEARQ